MLNTLSKRMSPTRHQQGWVASISWRSHNRRMWRDETVGRTSSMYQLFKATYLVQSKGRSFVSILFLANHWSYLNKMGSIDWLEMLPGEISARCSSYQPYVRFIMELFWRSWTLTDDWVLSCTTDHRAVLLDISNIQTNTDVKLLCVIFIMLYRTIIYRIRSKARCKSITLCESGCARTINAFQRMSKGCYSNAKWWKRVQNWVHPVEIRCRMACHVHKKTCVETHLSSQ